VTGTAPVVVFQGETVDISQVQGTTGDTPGERAGLVGISGSAEGTFYEDSSDSFDFDQIETGTYDFDRDRNRDIIVRRPEVQRVRLYRGSATDGINVTNGRIGLSQDQITIQADFNFEESAEDVRVSVINPEGLDITPELTTNRRISADGETLRLSNISTLERGKFHVRVSGTGQFESTTRSVTFTRGRQRTNISFATMSIAQGGIINGTVRGNAGQRVQVRIPQSATEEETTADQVYENSDNVGYLTDQPTLRGDRYHTAVIEIGSSGRETVRIDTQQFRVNQVVSVTAANGINVDNPAVSEASFEVTSPNITIQSAPSVVAVDDTFRIRGSGPENGIVRAYVRNGSDYVPLRDADGNPIELETDADGTYALTASVSPPMDEPGSYDIVITGNDRNDENEVLSSSAYQDIQLRAVTTLRTQEENLTADLSSEWIATNIGDSVTISGYTTGSSIRFYIVEPQGTVLNASGTPVQQLNAADELTPTDGMFTESAAVWDTAGEYQVIVVSAPNETAWDRVDNIELNGLDSREAVGLIQNQYQGDESPFSVITLSLQANASQVTIETPRSGETISRDNITISGQSNRETGRDIFIEVLSQNQTVLTTEARVDGRNNTWQTTINASELGTGSYTIRVNDGISTTSTRVEVVGPVPNSQTSVTQTGSTVTEAESTTNANGPGFTVLSVIVAIFAFLIGISRLHNR
jgi:hypothetical protein